MSKNEFDDLLRKKFQKEELPYNPKQWEKLSKRLLPVLKPERKYKLGTIALGVAAAIALLLASVLLVKFVNQDNFNNHFLQGNRMGKMQEEPTGVPEQKATRKNAVAAATGQDAATEKEHNNADNNHHTTTRSAIASLQDKKNNDTDFFRGNHAGTPEIVSHQPSDDIKKVMPIPAPEHNSQFERKGILQHLQNINQGAQNDLAGRQQSGLERQTIIAIGGGVNYGSLNAGYSVGITAQHKIGNNFFVDGTIAMIYNNNINNAGNYAGPTPAFAARPVSGQSVSSQTFTPSQNLYYVQFNPSFGYEIGDKISISMGGDMQQMISDDNYVDKIQIYSDGVRVFPTLDLGVTGKAEFNVAPHIQAGVIFREGLNNFLMSNGPTQYVNRRYFQVQFKYAIPVQ